MTARELSTRLTRVSTGELEYRLDRRGERVVVVLHGGHMRASLRVGENDLEALGCSVLAPSRPGYGGTGPETSPEAFADAVRELCDELEISQIAAVVGISAGGPTAIALAGRHPDLVQRLILESSVGLLPWPDGRSRIAATVLFNRMTERVTWAAVRAVMRVAPTLGLRGLLSGLTTRPIRSVVAALSEDDRAALVELFSQMRSGSGFENDLRHLRKPAMTLPPVQQPAMVIASRHDRAVPFAHAQSLATSLPHARLVESDADTHFLWFGRDRQAISKEIRAFLTA